MKKNCLIRQLFLFLFTNSLYACSFAGDAGTAALAGLDAPTIPASEDEAMHFPNDEENPEHAAQTVLNNEANKANHTPDISHKYQYKVRGQQYKVFANGKNFQQIGTASWYGPGFHGKRTANGEIYDMHAMTAAHKTLPLGTRVQVTNLSNGLKIIVRINDRGPFHGGRVIDLSKQAAKKLGLLRSGQGKVHIKIIE